MARNRQRAKDRKQKLQRDNVPGSLDHASAEVDQVEARIVAGADGVPDDDVDDARLASEAVDSEQLGDGGGGGGRDRGDRAGGGADDDDGGGDVATAPPTREQSGSRLVNFLRASWAELQRVMWPDRRQVGQGTAVVLGFVVLAGAFLGFADVVAQRIVDLIL